MDPISAIEEALENDLEAAGLNVRDFDIDTIKKGTAHPAVLISTEAGVYRKKTLQVYGLTIEISLVVVFRSVKSEKDRRRGIYPSITGIVQRLLGKTLGLDIEPVRPKGWSNITDEDFHKLGLTVYEIELSTGFDVKKTAEIDEDLLSIGLSYYLQDPVDDDISDASDVVTLGT